jgi:DNA-binding MarR family transcriptional regulator
MVDDFREAVVPRENFRRIVDELLTEIDRRIATHLQGTSYDGMRQSDLKVGYYASRKPSTASELARDLKISRQAVHSSLERLKALDVIDLESHPTSNREKIVVFTEGGRRAQEVALAFLKSFDNECAGILGQKGFEQFRQQLLTLVTALKLRDDE